MGGYSWQHFYNSGSEYTNDFYDVGTPSSDQEFASEYFLVSFYGRLNYSYKGKYLLTGTVRRDGTSRFRADGDNQWGVFPSAALAWRISEEDFLSDNALISELKLRLGWGVTGQQDVTGNAYVGYPTYTLSDAGAQYVFGDSWFKTYRPNGYDPDLKWEETTSTNIGVDFAILNDRLSGSVDYYYRETKDLINSITVAAGTNLSDRIISNVGSLENEGVEVNITGRPISKPDFFWEIGANYTYNRNEITNLTVIDDPSYVGVASGDLGSGNYIQMQSVGYALNTFYLYEQVYDQDNNPLEGVYVDQDNNGIINSLDRIHYGNSTPDVLIGLNTSLRYKNWDFNMSGRFQFGAQIYNGVEKNSANWVSVYSATTQSLSNKLTSASDNNFRYSDEQRVYSSHWIEDADFFKLDNATIGYNFKSLFGDEKRNLRVSLTGQNLLVISPYSGIDPEVFDGIDNNLFPRPTTIMVGVKLGF